MDPTGWRRYWPVKVGTTDLAWLAANRAQLFAEAVVRYRAGETWWFDENTDEAQRLQKITSGFQVTHPWAEVIYHYVLGLKDDAPFSAVDVMRKALGRQTGDLTQGEKSLVGTILRHHLRCPAVKGPAGMQYLRPPTMPAVAGPKVVLPFVAK